MSIDAVWEENSRFIYPGEPEHVCPRKIESDVHRHMLRGANQDPVLALGRL